MRRIVSVCLILAAVSALPLRAHAQLSEMGALFSRGDYLVAAAQAEAGTDADSLAFAARAVLAQCMTGSTEPDPALVDRAAKDAEAALKIDKRHAEAKLQLAIALSLKSRVMDPMGAWGSGYGQRGKRLVEEVLKDDPGNAFAQGFLSVWNIEVRQRGGSLGAAMMGASVDTGRKHYAEAVKLSPDYVGIYWQYARALAALDARKYGDEIMSVLGRAIAAKADDHVETVMQARAVQLLAAMKADRKAAQKLAGTLL